MRAPREQTRGGDLPPRAGHGPAAGTPNVVTNPKGETAEVLSSGPIGNVHAEDVGQRDGLVRGSAVDLDAPPPDEPAEVLRWVVLRDSSFTHRGFRVKLLAGKVVDSLNYDHKHLIRQGVKLKKLEPGEDPADAMLAAGAVG